MTVKLNTKDIVSNEHRLVIKKIKGIKELENFLKINNK